MLDKAAEASPLFEQLTAWTRRLPTCATKRAFGGSAEPHRPQQHCHPTVCAGGLGRASRVTTPTVILLTVIITVTVSALAAPYVLMSDDNIYSYYYSTGDRQRAGLTHPL